MVTFMPEENSSGSLLSGSLLTLGVHTLVLHPACGWSWPAPSHPQSTFIRGLADGESSLLTSEMRVFIPTRGFRVAWKTGAVRTQHGTPGTHQFHWLQSPGYYRLNLVSEVEWLTQGPTDSKGRKNKSSESRPSALSIANYFFVVQSVKLSKGQAGLDRERRVRGSGISSQKSQKCGGVRKPEIREQTRAPCPMCQRCGLVLLVTCYQQSITWLQKGGKPLKVLLPVLMQR